MERQYLSVSIQKPQPRAGDWHSKKAPGCVLGLRPAADEQCSQYAPTSPGPYCPGPRRLAGRNTCFLQEDMSVAQCTVLAPSCRNMMCLKHASVQWVVLCNGSPASRICRWLFPMLKRHTHRCLLDCVVLLAAKRPSQLRNYMGNHQVWNGGNPGSTPASVALFKKRRERDPWP